jgi:cytochrome c
MNKIAAAILTAGVVAMATGFVSRLAMPVHHGGHGEETHQAYVIEPSEGTETAKAAEGPSLEPVLPLLADADPAAGEKVAKKCKACHSFEEGGPNKIGPNLWGVVTRPIASHEGFSYSGALQEKSGETWTYSHLNAFLHKPGDFASGTKMTFAGLKSVDDRANVIAYLRTLSGSPAPLPTQEEIDAVTGASTGEPAAEKPAAEAPAAEAPAAEEQPAAEQTASEQPAEGGQSAAETAQPEQQAAASEASEGTAMAAAGGGGSELGALLAAGDPEAGAKVARKCKACHSFEKGQPNKVGPNLYGVIGRPVASKEGYTYSKALSEKSGETWTYEHLNTWLTNPKDFAPKNKMIFIGLKKPQDRADVIAYLRQMSDNPPPLPQ